VDARSARGTSGVVGAVWGVAEVVGTVQGAAKVGELGDEGVVRGRTV
jgi:hypothetical protein